MAQHTRVTINMTLDDHERFRDLVEKFPDYSQRELVMGLLTLPDEVIAERLPKFRQEELQRKEERKQTRKKLVAALSPRQARKLSPEQLAQIEAILKDAET